MPESQLDLPISTPPRWLKLVFTGLVILVTIAWFATLGTRRLLEPDEGRYAEISREMVATGDWVTPRLNGIKYFEKPALQYWATAAAYKVFGQNEFSARLWTGLTGFLGILLAYFTGRRLFDVRTGYAAAAILGSCLIYIIIGHINTLDMSLSFFLELTVFSFLIAQTSPPQSRSERNWMYAAWMGAALAFLSKGLVAIILPALTLVAYTVVMREFSAWKRLHLVKGLALFLLITAPWIIVVSLRNPEFPFFFFVHEHFARFLTTVHERDAPWWYFLPLLALGLMPWTSITFPAFLSSWRADESSGIQVRRFLWIWVISVVGFFSISHSKLPPYIIPAFPALALLIAEAVKRMNASQVRSHFLIIGACVGALTLVIALLPDDVAGQRSVDLVITLRPRLALSFFIVTLSAIIAAISIKRMGLHSAVAILGLGALSGLSVLVYSSDALRTTRSEVELAEKLKPIIQPHHKLYAVHQYSQTLPFYLGKTFNLVGYRGELDFGLTQEPQLWIIDIDAFLARWTTDIHPIAIMELPVFNELKERGISMQTLANDNDLIAITKPQEQP
jgi:4-amino-4-deoxy-L-arabinose transferase-like glycosyltransferase